MTQSDNSQSGESPSQLIDARIKELGDWRGETGHSHTTPTFPRPAARSLSSQTILRTWRGAGKTLNFTKL